MSPKDRPTHRLPLTSSVPLDGRAEALRDLFPEAVCEGRIDVDALRTLLGDTVETNTERYGLSWAGKTRAIRAVQQPSTGTLVPDRAASVDFDATGHVFIEGDNLEALKILQRSYSGTVKMVYIDPPYNTGREFIYPDNFRDSLGEYLRFTGQLDADGHRTSSSTDTAGRVHSRWLSFLYPRLVLARSLLRDDGLIAVSIDDHEVHNLRLLLDEIFGSENFVANLVWQKAYVANMTARFISATHDHILIYARDHRQARVGRFPRTAEQLARFTNPDHDPRGPWKAENLSAGKFYAAGQFPITTPSGLVVTPPPGRYWRCHEARYREWLADDRIWFGADGTGRPMLKKFLSEVQDGLTPETWWRHELASTNKQATTELKKMFGGRKLFDTPKPVPLLERLISLLAPDGGTVLDFFAGSGATGHAVHRCNAADRKGRRYILVQLPEATELEDFPTIAHITRARLRAAAAKLTTDQPKDLDLGMRAYRLARSNFKTWNPSAGGATALAAQLDRHRHSLHADPSAEAVLTELLLKSGHQLTVAVDRLALAGETVYSVGGGRLLVCLADRVDAPVLQAMMHRTPKPRTILCLDHAFAGDDMLLTNTILEMKAHGIEHFRTA